ncbi:MAG: 50S ribosomal protein L10 [Candidatus Magasanikbacteria bacterium]|nr:50S ribosomal protein L10 [Candidatus Magasanikbacteria bacterium]
MPKTRDEKTQIVADLTKTFKEMKSAVFADFKGLKVKDITELRRLCQGQKISYGVAKKTLIRLAAKDAGLDFNPDSMDGSYAMACGLEDEVAPAKMLADFAKKHEALKILGGILEGKTVDKTAIGFLAKLPSKPELLAKLVGSLQSPISGLVNVLVGNLRGLAQVLNAYQKSKS